MEKLSVVAAEDSGSNPVVPSKLYGGIRQKVSYCVVTAAKSGQYRHVAPKIMGMP